MEILEAILLGIIQGLTEFLPVSSSGHIELGKAILGEDGKKIPLLFTIMVHGATALSTIVVYRRSILDIFSGMFRSTQDPQFHYALKIALSMIPVGIVGVFFEDRVEALFTGDLFLVGSMLLITAFLLFLTIHVKSPQGNITYPKAFIIGLAQAIAIFPGISRSGSTISASLLLNINREQAAKFSFLMVLPPILGALILKVVDLMKSPAEAMDMNLWGLVLGFLAAFFSGVLACKWMIRIVQGSKLIYFSIYCVIIGGTAIIISFL